MHAIALVFLAALVVQPAAPAQPNFSGTWVAVSPRQVEGQRLTITQDAAILTLELVTPGGDYRASYRLDGKRRPSPDAHAAQMSLWLSAKWDGDKLLLTDVGFPYGPRLQRTLGLDADGNLVIDVRTPYGGSNDPALDSESVTEPRRAIFKKK